MAVFTPGNRLGEILTSGSTWGEDVVPPCGIASSPTLPSVLTFICKSGAELQTSKTMPCGVHS